MQIFLAAVTKWRVEYEQTCRHKNSTQSVQMVSQISHTSPHHCYHVTRGARLAVSAATFQGVWPAVTGRAGSRPDSSAHYPQYQIAASAISTATTESEAGPGPPVSVATCEPPACGRRRGLVCSSTSKDTLHCQIYIFHFVFDLSPLYLILLCDPFHHLYSLWIIAILQEKYLNLRDTFWH